MALRVQGQGTYYYRSQRVDGKPRRIYVAAGSQAVEHAQRDKALRQRRMAQRVEWAAAELRIAAAEAALADVAAWTSTLAAAVLILSGYRQHRGTWRRRIFNE